MADTGFEAAERFCVDCRWCLRVKPHFPPNFGCTYGQPKDLVTGSQFTVSCYEQRSSNETCGEAGRLWESKP